MGFVHCTSPLWDLSTCEVSIQYLEYIWTYAPDKKMQTDGQMDFTFDNKQIFQVFKMDNFARYFKKWSQTWVMTE